MYLNILICISLHFSEEASLVTSLQEELKQLKEEMEQLKNSPVSFFELKAVHFYIYTTAFPL